MHKRRGKQFEIKRLQSNERINKENEAIVRRMNSYYKMVSKKAKKQKNKTPIRRGGEALLSLSPNRPKIGISSSNNKFSKHRLINISSRYISPRDLREENVNLAERIYYTKPDISFKALQNDYKKQQVIAKNLIKLKPTN